MHEANISLDKEEHVMVLDFLPNGYPLDDRPSYKKNPIAQTLGKEHFTLLEIVPKTGIFLQPNEEIYIGEGKRDKVHHIVGKLQFDKLTETGKNTLRLVVKNVVEKIQVNLLISIMMLKKYSTPLNGKKRNCKIKEALFI